jgi:hypothetical protein
LAAAAMVRLRNCRAWSLGMGLARPCSSTSSGTFSEQQSASLQSVELMVACLSLNYQSARHFLLTSPPFQ